MRKWLVSVLLLGLLVLSTPAGAQGGIKLTSINIELWAEYDQPSMLVIQEFTLDEQTPLPANVTLRFPKEGNLTAVAFKDQTLFNAEYEGPASQGDWQIVTLNVASYAPHRIEYYQPLVRNGKQRSFSFQWFGDYAVDEFNIAAQLPPDSTKITADPPFSSLGPLRDSGHLVGILTFTDLGMGQAHEFTITYERESEAVTNPSNSASVRPSEPIGPNTEGRVSIDNLPWIIGGFGLALIGLALYFYWQSTHVTEQKSRRRRAGSRADGADGAPAYCHECGARANPGDRFCRTCGSKLRV